MKIVFITLVALALCAVGLQAQQKKAVKVQGSHPHELLIRKRAEAAKTAKPQSATVRQDTTTYNKL